MTSDVIVKKAAKGKFFELADSLILARPEDYANMWGVGGKNHAPRSGIAVRLTDYSSGQGVMVQSIVPVSVLWRILRVAEMNDTCGSLITEADINVESSIAAVNAAADQSSRTAVMKAAASMLSGGQRTEALKTLGAGLKTTCAGYKEQTAGVSRVKTAAVTFDWQYNQQRVNPYNVDAEGYGKCSTLSIKHAKYGANGEERKLPWNIRIQVFQAKIVTAAQGTSSYNSATVKDKKDVNINLSNEDMLDAAFTGYMFAMTWLATVVPANIQRGLANKQKEREAAT